MLEDSRTLRQVSLALHPPNDSGRALRSVWRPVFVSFGALMAQPANWRGEWTGFHEDDPPQPKFSRDKDKDKERWKSSVWCGKS